MEENPELDLVDLISYVTRALVDHPDQVSVNSVAGDRTTVFELRVAPDEKVARAVAEARSRRRRAASLAHPTILSGGARLEDIDILPGIAGLEVMPGQVQLGRRQQFAEGIARVEGGGGQAGHVLA